MSFTIRDSRSLPSGASLMSPFCVEPSEDDLVQWQEILLQEVEWDSFMKETPKEVLNDPSVWQYWRKENRPKGGTMASTLEKMFVRRLGMGSKVLKAQIRLKTLIRNGVPPQLRGDIWWRCCGGAELQQKAKEQERYEELLKHIPEMEANGSHVLYEIDKDLPRTMPELKVLTSVGSPVLASMRRILLAYAVRNQNIGYCQSMNFLACLLLLHMEEERAFWALSSLLENILPPDYYSPNMIGGRVDQAVFQACLLQRLPSVYRHLQDLDCALDPIVLPWFLCCFINALPLYTVVRVWDSLLWEGDMILFKTAISMLRSKEEEVLSCSDFVSIYCALKSSRGGQNHTFQLEEHPLHPDHSSSSSFSASASGKAALAASLDDAARSPTSFLLDSTFSLSLPRKVVAQLRAKFLTLITEFSRVRAEAAAKRLADDLEAQGQGREREGEGEEAVAAAAAAMQSPGPSRDSKAVSVDDEVEPSPSPRSSSASATPASAPTSTSKVTPVAAPVRGNSIHKVRGLSETECSMAESARLARDEARSSNSSLSPRLASPSSAPAPASAQSKSSGWALSSPALSNFVASPPPQGTRAVRRMSHAQLVAESMSINIMSSPGLGMAEEERERLNEVVNEMRTRERQLSVGGDLHSAIRQSVFLFNASASEEDEDA